VGRLKKDKGVLDLAKAFSRMSDNCPDAHLLFVGPDEENLSGKIMQYVLDKNRIHFVPYTDNPEKFMAAADVLCLPSYREGFGNVIIEAAACAVPSIGSRIYGITDAIQENITGKLHTAGNVDEIARLLREFYQSADIRLEMGKQAYLRAKRDFSKEYVASALVNFYENILQS
jgi:glycosyltransferase involved in cell wall biosynthesis